jgi:hypothetical protein
MSDSTTEATQSTPPDVQALIDSAVAGLKAKNSEILGTLKATKERLAALEGIDPEGIRSLLSKVSEDEDKALIKSGDIDAVINKRTERMKAGFEAETKAEREARERAESRVQAFSKRVLENSIRAEAGAAGLHQFAVEDALYRAGSMFVIDDNGNPVAAEGVLGKDGKPLTLKEWFGDMKEKAPHWFPAAQSGSGAQGNTNGKGSSRTMSRTEFEALSPSAKMAASKSGIQVI